MPKSLSSVSASPLRAAMARNSKFSGRTAMPFGPKSSLRVALMPMLTISGLSFRQYSGD